MERSFYSANNCLIISLFLIPSLSGMQHNEKIAQRECNTARMQPNMAEHYAMRAHYQRTYQSDSIAQHQANAMHGYKQSPTISELTKLPRPNKPAKSKL